MARFTRKNFKKDSSGKIVFTRKNYNPKAKQTGTPKVITVNSTEVEVFEDGFKLNMAPVSVNDVWQGRRFRTPYYDQYEKILSTLLPKMEFPPQPWKVLFIWGFNRDNSDWDNPIKPFQDVLQAFYKFNDSKIYDGRVIKNVVGKGKEYIIFKIKTYNPNDEIIF